MAPTVPTGNLYNTTGHLLTATNRKTLRWTGTRWVYTRTAKGKKVTREIKKATTPSPPKLKRKYTRKIGPTLRGRFKGTSTNYANREGRVFFRTPRGSYVVRHEGKSLYQRKARYYQGALLKSLNSVPAKIRPAKLPRKKRTYRRGGLF
jgi:hypothetical protein